MRCIAALVLAGCLPAVLPPPATPAPAPVIVPPRAPEPGKGQVTIATADGEPAVVEEATGHLESTTSDGTAIDGTTYRTVCSATPCTANLEPGDHALRFTALGDPAHGGTGTITVDEQPSVYRYALGQGVAPEIGGGGALVGVGVAGVITGLTLVLLSNAGPEMDQPNTGPLGLATLAAGGALTALGLYLWERHRGAIQPGAGVQWTR